jgi:YD repeat-containing protein
LLVNSAAYASSSLVSAYREALSEDGPWDNDTVSVTYANRLLTGLTLGGSWSVTYGYDAARRLTNVVSPAGSVGYGYDSAANGQWKKLSLPGGAYMLRPINAAAPRPLRRQFGRPPQNAAVRCQCGKTPPSPFRHDGSPVPPVAGKS